MGKALNEHALPCMTGNVCLFVEVNQLINIEHNTSLVDHSGHFCDGGVGFMTRFESFIYCLHKRQPTIDLSVRAQLAGPIVVPVPGLILEVGSNNPNKVGVAIPGTSVMVKIIVNGLVPLLLCGVGIDGTIVCVQLGNLEFLLLLSLLHVAMILHNQKAFPLAHSCLPAMSRSTFQGAIPGAVITITAGQITGTVA